MAIAVFLYRLYLILSFVIDCSVSPLARALFSYYSYYVHQHALF